MLAGGGLRPGRRVMLACRVRRSVSNGGSPVCGSLAGEQSSLVGNPDDHEQSEERMTKVVVVFGCSGSADSCVRDADAAPGRNDAPAFPRCLVWFHDCA